MRSFKAKSYIVTILAIASAGGHKYFQVWSELNTILSEIGLYYRAHRPCLSRADQQRVRRARVRNNDAFLHGPWAREWVHIQSNGDERA